MALKIVLPARPALEASIQTMSSELEVRIRKRFANPEGSFHLNVHFRALAGFTILFGASGAGKTTLLDCIAGLTPPDEGRIVAGGEVLYDRDKKQNVAAWNRRIGYVHQDLALFPHLTAEENIAYGLRGLGASERKARSREMLETFGIDHLRQRRPEQISGGERQRVALARALVTEPRALFLMSLWRRSIARQNRQSSATYEGGTRIIGCRFFSSPTVVRRCSLSATK